MLTDQSSSGFALEVKPVEVTPGVSFGLVSNDREGDGVYLMVRGRDVRLYEIATPLVELTQYETKHDVTRVGLFNTHVTGAVLTVDGRPLWELGLHVPDKVGPAMIRKPELRPDDQAVVQVTTFVATELSYEKTGRSSRIIEPAF